VIAALDRRLFAPSSAERIAAVRVLVGLFGTIYVAARTPYILDVARLPAARFEPVGVLSRLDAPVSIWLVRAVLALTLLLGAAFTVGWRYRVVAPLYAVGLLLAMSYSNSWQHLAHVENLLVLHTGVLAVAPAAAAWSLDRRRRVDRPPAMHADYGWPLRVMTVLTVITYVLAGVAKLRHGGGDWVSGDVLRNLIAHDNLRKILLGDVHSPIGGWLVSFGWLFPPMALASLVVELGAPMVFVGPRIRRAWVLAAWLFHLGVLALMAITFIYPLSGVAYASMLHPEVAVERIRARLPRRAPTDARLATYGHPDAG
jgi:hypothetical protein